MRARFRENLLFTHRGLSGPAILQISSYWNGREPLAIDLLPGFDAASVARARSPASAARARQPAGRALAEALRAAVVRGARLRRARTATSAASGCAASPRRLQRWEVLPSGTLGYNKAEVTLGGVDTRGLSSKTMAAAAVPGLYFIGEVVDVTGWLGGYNFQWAWASGHAAGTFA